MGRCDQLLGARLASRLLEAGGEGDLLVVDRAAGLQVELPRAALEIALPRGPRAPLNRHLPPPLRLLRLACSTSDPATLPVGSRRQTRPGRCEGKCSPVRDRASWRRSSARPAARRAGAAGRARARPGSPP